jgi:hypothetical protein
MVVKSGDLVWDRPRAGRATKIIVVAEGSSVTLSIHTASASPHEVTLLGETLTEVFFVVSSEMLREEIEPTGLLRIERSFGLWASR